MIDLGSFASIKWQATNVHVVSNWWQIYLDVFSVFDIYIWHLKHEVCEWRNGDQEKEAELDTFDMQMLIMHCA